MALRTFRGLELVTKYSNRILNTEISKLGLNICAGYSTKEAEYADVVISGGGMVGAAMACALANNKSLKDKKIVLLEMDREKGDYILSEKYSNRTCALSPATVRLLSSFGAWQEIESLRCHPVLRMQIWESCADAMITFNNQDMTEPLAYIVENDVILAGIMKALKSFNKQVEVRYQTNATSYSNIDSQSSPGDKLPYIEMTLNDGSRLKTKLLIGADGMNSNVRKTAGFHTIKRDYGQAAVVAIIELGESSQNNTAWQRFLPTGPIALLPMSNNLSSLIWTTTHENSKNLLAIPSESFVDAVNDALWHEREKNSLAGQALNVYKNFLQNVLPDSDSCRQLPPTAINVLEKSRASFPLTLIHSSQYVKPRVVLIGDAGHRLHPLAGQGVNLGFGDLECLNEILTKAVQNGADLGSLTHLLEFETQRQRHNVPVMATIDGLQRLYSTDFTPLVLLRSLGLHTVQSLPFLKNFIISRASV